ncbi:SprT-like family-domain-containing protein [Paraphoma chrysanthemicola]|uniref:SprT-like family-domain-containing protein n=1 Tax=Paraphoma chrysanthemicola TaxID=798071 RepID=A0A8K0RH66_9PLEO|nr:SprT-like family-domain-containing protein [Paraphoma chrysanthemicola]
MARLRKPSPNEPTIFTPTSAPRATRSSPRKGNYTRYATSSDDEEPVLVPKASKRDLRYTVSSQHPESSFLIPKSTLAPDTLTPRKQRILRPVESNSRLLRKLSDESLASPEKKQRERRVRSGTTDTDVGKKTNLLYAKTLARSVVKKQASRAQISVLGEDEFQASAQKHSSQETETAIVAEVEVEDEAETSLWCGDQEEVKHKREDMPVVEISDDEEEDDPVVDTRQRRQRPRPQRIESEQEDDDEETPAPEAIVLEPPAAFDAPHDIGDLQAIVEAPRVLKSMRPPHRKGHSTISNWAQEVIDLTDSPEPPASFVLSPLPPPNRVRSASFASSRPQTSSSNAPVAMLSYSPTPTKRRSPCKAPPISRPVTPPLAPPSPSKLVSPSKKKPTIPKAPDLRPSLDAFWNPEVVNEWNERHSPVKPLVSPKKQKWREDIVKMMEGVALEDDESDRSDNDFPSPTTSPRKNGAKGRLQSPVKKSLPVSSEEMSVKDLRAQRKAFAERKHAMAEAFLEELDITIADGQIRELSRLTGGIKLVWSRTLKTTAGRANWKREQIRVRTGPLPVDFRTEIRHHCSIELAEKVIDDEERLYNVLAHEFCHLTTFMISNVRNNPHGAEFKSWGRKATAAFASKGVEVTTKHSYQIDYKFVWECVSCGYEFKRHSKSVDTSRHSCGRCKGKLVQTKPTPRNVGNAAVGKDGKREKSEYQVFVKTNFSLVKKRLQEEGQDAQMGKVMEAVAREYREMQAQKTQNVGGLEEALEGLKI